MRKNENYQDTQHEMLRLLDSIVHGKRANVFLSISKGDRTFRDLLDEVVMSKGGLSDALAHLSQSGIIAAKPKEERIFYELTPLGFFVRDQLTNCGNLVSSFTLPKEKKMLFSFEDIIKMIEADTTLSDLFADGWTVILSSETYVRLTEYLDEKILEGSKRAKEFENLLYENNLVQVVQTYSNPENSVKVEFYLRKQKKLKPDEAEMVATAVDQDAIICTSSEKIMLTGFEQGLHAVKVDQLHQFLDKQKSIISYRTSMDKYKGRFYKPMRGQFNSVFSMGRDNAQYRIAGSSSIRTDVKEEKTINYNVTTLLV